MKSARFLTAAYRQLMSFIMHGMWETTTGTARRILVGTVRRLVITTRLFLREKMQYRASALTYSSLLSVVPLLAIIFAIAKGFGLSAFIQERIRSAIPADPAVADPLVSFVQSYLDHTQGGVFIGFGLILLLWTLIRLTQSVEVTFNQIWQVKRARSLSRMLTDYTAMFFLLPIFIVVSGGITLFATTTARESVPDMLLLRPTAVALVRIIPYVLVCLFFTALYAFIPNTQVRLRSALLAGIPVGIAFQVLQYAYVHSQMWLSGYNAIYGSFAALPLFMLMCNICWMLVLLGGTLCYVDQNICGFYYGHDAVRLSRLEHDCLCVRLAATVCRQFAASGPPLTAGRLAEKEKTHLRIVTDALGELVRAGILLEITEERTHGNTGYMPASDIRRLTAPAVLTALDTVGDNVHVPQDRRWEEFVSMRRDMFGRVFPDTPLCDWPAGSAPPEKASAPAAPGR